MPTRPGRRLVAGAVLVTAMGLLAGGCSLLPAEPELAPPPLEVPARAPKELFPVKKGPIADRLTLRAAVGPAREVSLYYGQGGRIKAVHVSAGDTVAAGQLLAELDSGDLLFEITAAELGLKRAELDLAEARDPATLLSAYERQRRELAAELAALQLRRLRAQLQESRLVAPFAGVVSAVDGRRGDLVQSFQPLIRLADPSGLVIGAEVSESELTRLALNQRVTLDFPDLRAGTGRIVQLPAPGSAAAGGPRRALIALDQPDPAARMGMTGKVHVLLEEKREVLLLPKAAIRIFGGRTYVVVQTPEGRREVDVAVGIQGESEVEILSGLKEGDQVMGR